MKRLARQRLILMPLTAAVLLAGTVPARALENGGFPDLLARWFPQWFGEEDTGPRPEDTLQAPFSDASGPATSADGHEEVVVYRSTDGNEYRRMRSDQGVEYDLPVYVPPQDAESAGDLSTPHRQPAQIAEWLTRASSEIFTMDSENYRDHLLRLSTGMSQGGLVDFNQFMRASGVLDELEKQGKELRGYVEQPPLLLNEGAINGRYRWLFEMPITLTVLDKGTRDYRSIERTPDMVRYYVVQTQIGRVDDNATQDDIEIETWKVSIVETPPASPATPQ